MLPPEPTEFARRVRRSTTALGFPTIMVAVLWVAMWLLWRGPAPRRAVRGGAAPRVMYGDIPQSPVMNPAIFARPGGAGFRLPASDPTPLVDESLGRDTVRLRFLDPRVPEVTFDAAGPAQGPRARAAAQDEGYRPLWHDAPVLAALATGRPRLRVEVRGGLEARAFAADDTAGLTNAAGPADWQASAYVEIDARGIPRQVLLERSSGDRQRDMAVVKWLQRGRASAGRGRARGRVVVSYGR